MDIAHQQFLNKATQQAEQAGHIWPVMAACEAALESGWGKSALAIEGHNLFVCRQHATPIYETIALPTREYILGQYIQVNAYWVSYPTEADCFTDRMQTLRRLPIYYGAALSATNPIDYVREVSKSWSTDPERAAKVIAIYNEVTGTTTGTIVTTKTTGTTGPQ